MAFARGAIGARAVGAAAMMRTVFCRGGDFLVARMGGGGGFLAGGASVVGGDDGGAAGLVVWRVGAGLFVMLGGEDK
eukprot:4289713-Pyramimonas_sp.AAC.1